MTKKTYWDIRVRGGKNRPDYSVPIRVRGRGRDKAIEVACVSGAVSGGDCDMIEDAREITQEQYEIMTGVNRVKPEVIKFEEFEDESKRKIQGKEIVHDEWHFTIDVRANSMSEAKRLALREMQNQTDYPKKKLYIDDCERVEKHLFRCRTII